LGPYEYYEENKKINHYSHLILETNIKLSIYKGRLVSKMLWKISMQEHEETMNALHEKEDADGIGD